MATPTPAVDPSARKLELLHPSSLYAHLVRGIPLQLGDMLIDSRIRLKVGDTEFVLVCIDQGNSHTKVVLVVNGIPITLEIPNIIAPRRQIVSGQRTTSYVVEQPHGQIGLGFVMGDEAENDPDAVPLQTGATNLRLSDYRQIEFVVASIVKAFRAAGFQPGAYTVVLGIMIPNEEVLFDYESDKGEKSVHVIEDTAAALSVFKRTTYRVIETDTNSESHQWSITFLRNMPSAQTLGAYTTFTKTVNGGNAIQDYVQFGFVDVGHGDVGYVKATTKPRFRVATGRITQGTKRITLELGKSLRDRDVQARRMDARQANAAELQHMLKTKKRIEQGREVSLSTIIDQIIAAQSAAMTTAIIDEIRGDDAYTIIHGGAIRMAGVLELLQAQTSTNNWNVRFCDPQYASIVNAFGGFMRIYWDVLKRKGK